MGEDAAAVDVGEAGVTVSGLSRPATLDVLFGGNRVWSFRALPDDRAERPAGPPRADSRAAAVPSSSAAGSVHPWPVSLRNFLHGRARVTVRYHAGATLYDADVRFGTADREIAIRDRDGHPLGIDNDGRLVRTFETRDPAQFRPLLDALERVLTELDDAGLAAFPAYGTLLGAVREGGFIGHDSDADVGYLSRYEHPVDVIRESFRVQRRLRRRGLTIARYSGGAFRVDVREADGSVRGLDVFAGFFYEGNLALLGEVFQPYRREWMLPLGTVEMAGRLLPAPAEPERLLAAMYGPSWRVPDPAFKFTTPQSTIDRFDAWFRGMRVYRADWDRRYALARRWKPPRKPHELAEVLHGREPVDAFVVDVGCGRGQDAAWLARSGHRVWALDYSRIGARPLAEEATAAGWPVHFGGLNLLELRHVLGWGARFAGEPGPRAMLARNVAEATTPEGRHHLWRLARMTLAGGGRLYLEFLHRLEGEPREGPSLLRPLPVEQVAEELSAVGGRVLSSESRSAGVVDLGYVQREHDELIAETTRMVVEWSS